MYQHLDSLLAQEKQKIKSEFQRLFFTGFDELNVMNTRRITERMYDKFLADNEVLYLKAAKESYKEAVDLSKEEGFTGKKDTPDAEWLVGVLAGYNLVSGYIYKKEAERKRMRLNEQVLTAREFVDSKMFQDSIRKAANLWWTQTSQYGITVVDEATIKGYKDMGVRRVKWIAANDEKTCPICGGRDNKIYRINQIPPKPHYGCRCYVVPVNKE